MGWNSWSLEGNTNNLESPVTGSCSVVWPGGQLLLGKHLFGEQGPVVKVLCSEVRAEMCKVWEGKLLVCGLDWCVLAAGQG